MARDITFLKALVANTLQDENRTWTAQGFGFLRTYFGTSDAPKKYRLNLWDHKFTLPNVSTIHDHPWDFTSIIVAGVFINQRFDMTDSLPNTHTYSTITTGINSDCKLSDKNNCTLIPWKPEYYKEGDTYNQKSNEIHETKFYNGSITLNERIGDTEKARVFWPYDTEWVDAIPRIATNIEIKEAVERSLQKWFK